MKEFKIVVLGSGGVGKSAMTVQFVTKQFVELYDPTIEDFYRKEVQLEGQSAVVEILDTAGTEQFASMRDLYITSGEGFIVVYSITNHQTFEDVKTIRDQILRVKGRNNVPIVIAANKSDLEEERQVTTLEGQKLAQELSYPFFECTAKIYGDVNPVFIEIAKVMNERNASKSNSFLSKLLCCISGEYDSEREKPAKALGTRALQNAIVTENAKKETK